MTSYQPPLQKAVAAQLTRVGSSRQWNSDKGITVYSRICVHMLGGVMYNCFDIASVEVAIKGKGKFTRYLEMVERMCQENLPVTVSAVYVESIHNTRLRDFLIRRGYSERKDGGVSSCYLILPNAKPLSSESAMRVMAGKPELLTNSPIVG